MRTNPAYAELAFRKAITVELINVLRSQYTSAYGGDPQKRVICEDVFRDDSEVPEGYIESFIDDLTKQEADIDLELKKFEFVKRKGEDEQGITGKKAEEGNRGRHPQGGGEGQAKRAAVRHKGRGRRPAEESQ